MKIFVTSILLLFGLLASLQAQSDAEVEAAAVFEQFLDAMTNTDMEVVTSLFSEDALFWGTGSQSLVTDPAGVALYFEPVGRNPPGQTVARARDYESVEIGNNLVAISGMWEVVPSGQSEGTPLRVSMVLALRNGTWKIIQFHNSAVPQ